ncbi:MAG TPA: 50S ribosomal protein L17 [Candidatus Pacearchaeota archaeon]|nr:50S ribosomal protein L17 [Candidatus Parcubacteria bacterium]HNZ83716.1 50S ribosomal protein L17 [Candidatus Pacearchaeota archaeon]HOU45848.1 50S ribosomal protein L17 [Candidatus Pacearchaeota archaeon]HPM08366.1 50S ribosomal protein L17 [Candidatus Pacearchaeota archaeon]HQI74363.1 50S ribosomal protein L17 [Candidatus Pacearchaeota archaeon]
MQKKVKSTRKFNRGKDQRKAFFKSLCEALFKHGRIKTTLARAKAIRPIAEKLITKARNNDLASIRLISSFLTRKTAQILVKEIAPEFKDVKGGYTRIIKLGPRKSDSAKMAFIELTHYKKEKVKAVKEHEKK